MRTIVFCLEEPSAKEMLTGLLPRLLPDDTLSRFIVFEGKSDLEKRLPIYLRNWKTPNVRFVVIRDQDSADCHIVKTRLFELCRKAGRPETLVRVACHELETFYLGDLSAVQAGLRLSGLAKKQNSRKFRDPDHLANPAQELRRITHEKYQKMSGSRSIGPYLALEGNRSRSFQVLISGLKRLLENA